MIRDVVFRFRLSHEEKEQLLARATVAGVSSSELVRKAIIQSQLVCNKSDQDLLLHIARIGNNVSQLARWVRTYKSTAETIRVVSMLMSVMRELQNLREGL